MVRWLRAAGEPSRLRLLALCARDGFSVTALSEALGQSEPRVSRHLKILAEAGLIERQRTGPWVRYRVSRTGEAASFVAGLLAQVDRRDPSLQRDLAAGARAQRDDGAAAVRESRLGRALAQLVGAEETAPGPSLVIGVTHPELLATLARSGACTALAAGRRAAQAARGFIEQHGLTARVRETASATRLAAEDLARAGGPFERVLLDRPWSGPDELTAALALARAALAPGGKLWVFERYEMLEASGQRVVEHPLARLRRLLADAGLACERLTPLESDGEHVLAAVAHAAPGVTDARAERA